MDIFVGVIVGLLVLMTLVTLHELGHFIAARRNGVRVLEFGICFPPRLVAWVKDPTTKKWKRLPKKDWKKPQEGLIFSFNWLPIGGFCQMDGESDADTRKGTFGAAGFWAKTKILFAGVAMNWIAAVLILTILAWTGMPQIIDGQFNVQIDTREEYTPVEIAFVAEESPAASAELKAGDSIIAVGGEEFNKSQDIKNYNTEHAGEKVIYSIKRDGEMKEIEVTLNSADADYLIGIVMQDNLTTYATWSAPIVGIGLTAQLTGETFKGVGEMLWNLITGVGSQLSFDQNTREQGQQTISEVGDSVAGPVGIIGTIFPSSISQGPTVLALLTAIISISLACMNVIPIPALDGGRWLLITVYKIRKKKLTKETEEKVVSRAMVALLVLIAIVTILDIMRITG